MSFVYRFLLLVWLCIFRSEAFVPKQPHNSCRQTVAPLCLSLLSIGNPLAFLWPNKDKDQTEQLRIDLKEQLIATCRAKPRPTRATIEALMDELVPLSPMQATSSSPQLQKEWNLYVHIN